MTRQQIEKLVMHLLTMDEGGEHNQALTEMAWAFQANHSSDVGSVCAYLSDSMEELPHEQTIGAHR